MYTVHFLRLTPVHLLFVTLFASSPFFSNLSLFLLLSFPAFLVNTQSLYIWFSFSFEQLEYCGNPASLDRDAAGISKAKASQAAIRRYFKSDCESQARFKRLHKVFSDPMTEVYLLFLQSILSSLSHCNQFCNPCITATVSKRCY